MAVSMKGQGKNKMRLGPLVLPESKCLIIIIIATTTPKENGGCSERFLNVQN